MSIAKAQFRGKTIEDMSRDELLEVLEYLSNELRFYATPERSWAFARESVERMKRGEKPEPKPESSGYGGKLGNETTAEPKPERTVTW